MDLPEFMDLPELGGKSYSESLPKSQSNDKNQKD